ncbi:MAG: DUF4961 domain-containing protein [Ignavibacteriales bacterium]|nr:MAG: DUF4961 domain-containing protein [Ignavibacteriales bacterium]
MKKRTTKISVLVISAIVALIIAGCFVIVSVTQPSTVQGLEQFTATIVVNVEGQSDTSPHYAIAGLLIPNDWQVDSVWFTGAYTDYCNFLPANVPDNEPGGQVDYWTDSLEARYPSGADMKWVVYQSSTAHAVIASTVQATLYAKLTPSATQGSYNLGYFVSDAALDFSDATWYSTSLNNAITVSGVLPVELTSFTAAGSKDGVLLKWETATETNNRGFEIQKSNNGKEFNTIGFVSGNGTTSQKISYTFVDKAAQSGKFVYRLKQMDFSGAFEYSKSIEVDLSTPKEFSLLKNYPNPFNPTTNLSFALPVESEVTLSVYNSVGQLIKVVAQGKYSAGTQNVVFDASDLPSGTYLYSISAKGSDGAEFIQTAKMLLLK